MHAMAKFSPLVQFGPIQSVAFHRMLPIPKILRCTAYEAVDSRTSQHQSDALLLCITMRRKPSWISNFIFATLDFEELCDHMHVEMWALKQVPYRMPWYSLPISTDFALLMTRLDLQSSPHPCLVSIACVWGKSKWIEISKLEDANH